MKTFATKIIRKLDKDVTVEAEALVNEVPAVKVRAVVGTTVVEQTHTFGPIDGVLAQDSPNYVQTKLDAVRERVATAAAFRSEIESQLQSAV